MQAWRRWCVYGLVAVIVGGHLTALGLDRELWPFSQYPMYAHATNDRTALVPRLVGVRRDGGEIALLDDRFLEPFDQARLMQALGMLFQQPDGPERAATALRDCLDRYERRRLAGAHDGPALGALRLYHMRWTLESTAANVNAPERRDVVLEVTRP